MEILILPLFLIKKICVNESKRIHLNILISSCIVLIVLFSLLKTNAFACIPHICLFQHFFNIPCPGCGILRSLHSLINLKVVSSINYNPVGVLLFVFIVSQIPLRITALLNPRTEYKINNFSHSISLILIFNLLVVWLIRVL